jgi:pimeloyl-ACP methyl ester carboxylesterase
MTQGWVDEGRVAVDGRTVAARQGGDPEGRALISFDRPGYGDSAAAPFSLSSIARDTGVLADALGVARFATVGQSGGGPFSLAAAAVLGDRVTRAGVASGAGPFAQVAELSAVLDETDRAALGLLPDRAAAAAQFAAGFEPLRGLFSGSFSQITGGFRQMLNAHDGILLDRPEFATCLVGAMQASLRNGTSGGGWDNVSWVGPWDFDLASIRQPVHLWYGEEDTMCPPVAGTWLDEHLPTATLVLRPGEGHMGVMEHAREIFTTLVSD